MKRAVQQILSQEGEQRAKEFLRYTFSFPDNIDLFGQWFFGQYTTLDTPLFHRLMWKDASVPGKKAFAAPRGHGKTTSMDMIFPAWVIVNRLKHFIPIISSSLSQSKTFVNILKEELGNNDLITEVYGSQVGRVWNDGEFETSGFTRVEAHSPETKIRGRRYLQWRPDLMLIDDLENDENVGSELQRQKLRRWFLRAAMRAGSKDMDVVYVGTVLHFDSLLKNIIDGKKEFKSWKRRKFQAIMKTEDGQEQSLWPQLYSIEELRAMRDDPEHPDFMGSIVFSQEMQNEPMSDEDAIIRQEWILIEEEAPTSGVTKTVMTIDPAISKKETADSTAKIIAKRVGDQKTGHVWITGISNRRMSFSEGVADAERWYRLMRPTSIHIESVAFQEAYHQALKEKHLPVFPIKRDKDKIRRVRAQSRFFEAHRVHFVSGTENLELAISQLLQFPLSDHDDIVDAIIDAVELLIGTNNEPRIRSL